MWACCTGGVRVVQQRDEDEPAVDDDVRPGAPREHVPAKPLARGDEARGRDGAAEAAHVDAPPQRRPELASLARPWSVGVGGGGGVADTEVRALAVSLGAQAAQVHRPAHEADDDDGAPAAEPAGQAAARRRRADGRHVGLAARHVVGVAVVQGVRVPPREIRHEERAVQHEAYGVVDGPLLGKRAVPTLVAEHPEAHRAGALHCAVEWDPYGRGEQRTQPGEGEPRRGAVE